jgi:DDE superfamily endonuclease
VAKKIGLVNGSERAIQRNIKNHGVRAYMAAQKKWLSQPSIDARNIYAHDRQYWTEKDFQTRRYCDESYFSVGLQRQARVHRRRGQKARNKLSKVQFKLKRQNQEIHVFGVVGHNYKGHLHFYTGTGIGGRLIQSDYVTILEEIVAPDWQEDWILVEDNDGPHGTRGKTYNKVKQAKTRLGIKWEANPPNSPDLNPIESIWRTIKQRLNNRGVINKVGQLRRAIEEEWDKLTMEEINKACATMTARIEALYKSGGKPIPFQIDGINSYS